MNFNPKKLAFRGYKSRAKAPALLEPPPTIASMHTNSEHAPDSYPLFDWLRFVLSSSVVMTHAGAEWWPNAGNFSVCVFFALSGWLIGGILLKTPLAGLPRFYFNRSIRIWIPYAVAIALLYGIAAVHQGTGGRFFQILFYDLTFTHYWFIPKIPEVVRLMPLKGTGSMFWSISVEEQFYLFAPLALLFVPKGRSVSFWVALSLIAVKIDYHYACIAMGVLAAILRNQFGTWYSKPLARILLGVVSAVSMFFIVHSAALYEVLVPPTALMIVLLCAVEGRRSSVGQFFGGVSYPLYLNHYLGVFICNALGKLVTLEPAMRLGLSYIFAVAVGAVLYIAVDRWVLQHKQSAYTLERGKWAMIVAYMLLALGVAMQFLWFKPLP